MKRKSKKSILVMLIIIFALAIFPISLLSFGIYNWGQKMASQEIMQSFNNRAYFFMDTLEQEVERVKKLQYDCLNDANLIYFVNANQIMSNLDKTISRTALNKRINLLSDSSSYIENVTLWITSDNQVISSNDGITILKNTDELTKIVKSKKDDSESQIIFIDNELYLCSSYPTSFYYKDTTPQFYLIIKLSTKKINDKLLLFSQNINEGLILSNSTSDYLILVGKDIKLVNKNEKINNGKYKYNNEKYLVSFIYSEYLNMNMTTYVLESTVYSQLYMYRNLFIFFIVLVFIFILIYLWLVNNIVSKPIKLLVTSISKVEQGNLSVRINHKNNDEFRDLYCAFNNMTESLADMVQINATQLTLNKEAELRQLQSQINPHFLYNSFFTLYRMAKDEDYESITRFLKHLSDYYRYITRNSKIDVTLEEEIEHAKDYVNIQLIRFNKRINVEFNNTLEKHLSILVPRLILQPILENAFDHGLKNIVTNGLIKVDFEENETDLIIIIEDNGQGIKEDNLKDITKKMENTSNYIENTGLINIHKRLKIKFGDRYGIKIENNQPNGIKFKIYIPKNND